MKKKSIPAVAALLMALLLIVVSLASCKKDNEQVIRDTIDTAMSAFVSFDQKTLKKQVESSVMETLNKNLSLIPQGDKIVQGLLQGMTYEVGEITINDDPQGVDGKVSATATAKLTVTGKNLKKEGAIYQLKVYTAASNGSMDLTDQKFLEEESKRVLDYINSDTVEMISTPMTLNLEKRSGKWVVILSGAPQNAMFGGAGSALNQIVSYVARAKNGGFHAVQESTTAA